MSNVVELRNNFYLKLIGSGSYSNCNFTFNFSQYGYTVNLCISKSCEPYFFYVCTIFICTCIFFQNELNVYSLPVGFFFYFHAAQFISYGITESTRTMCRGFPIYTQVALTEVRCKHHRLMTETSPNKNLSSGIDTISSMTFPISFSLSFGVLWFMQCTFMAEK